jgi:hypothetical protein
LIHSDTTNGSTSIVDSSPSGHTITSYGDPAHSTTQAKFGKTSIYQDSSDDSFGVATHADFNLGSQDWTLDFWWYPDSLQADYYFLHTAGTYNMLCLYYPSSGGFKILHSNPSAWQIGVIGGEGSISAGQWYHVAFVHASGANSVYLNGEVIAGPTTDTADVTGANASVNANSGYVKGNFEGYVEEYRISVGIARWTDSFVPPNKPYSVVDDDFVTDVAGIEDESSVTTVGKDFVVKSDPGEASTDSVFSVNAKDGTELMDVLANGTVTAGGAPVMSKTVWSGWDSNHNRVASSWESPTLNTHITTVDTDYATISGTTITIVQAGEYLVNLHVMGYNTSSSSVHYMRIMVDDVVVVYTHQQNLTGWHTQTALVSKNFAAGTEIEFSIYAAGASSPYTWHGLEVSRHTYATLIYLGK